MRESSELVYIIELRKLASEIIDLKHNKKFKKLSKEQKKIWNKNTKGALEYLEASEVRFKDLSKKRKVKIKKYFSDKNNIKEKKPFINK
jgi:hypothetical protein